uniref:RRM domain-containing protein n=1 Tax=Proboscia inermis TaxID=420281 RepID=A0A7S0GGS1_9STRA|mmetsp:Transcript_4739/g.4895  ORF Transcript_4739/g.4895 Transcript_4739/m.4895 type:complete len:127 (+) Transcript_4739:125-505(+)
MKGLLLLSDFQEQAVKVFLKAVFSRYGTIVQIYHHPEFKYTFVTYDIQSEAETALNGLLDTNSLRNIISIVVGNSTDETLAQNFADRIFVMRSRGLVIPSWAAPPNFDSINLCSFTSESCAKFHFL